MPVSGVRVAAVIMTEGLAFVCLIKTGLTITRAKVEKTIPRKRKGKKGKNHLLFLQPK